MKQPQETVLANANCWRY